MAGKTFSSLKELLPGVLAELARGTGSATRLAPVWDELVGPTIAKNARPLRFEGSTLVLLVTHPSWAGELERQGPELLTRLQERLGPRAPQRLVFRTSP
jgi:predicted nucleic acid-binding Zn ribbon protein